MFKKESTGLPPQIWFVVLMVLVLAALVASIILGYAPGGKRPASPSPVARLQTETPTARPSATASPAPTHTPTVGVTSLATPTPRRTLTPTPSVTATPTDEPTAEPTATASATATPSVTTAPPTATLAPTEAVTLTATIAPTIVLPDDHYWLERPIAPDGVNRIAQFYSYASRGDGTYPIHHGVEFVNPQGTEIRAVAPGTIIVAGDDQRQVYGARNNFYGLLVIQQLDQTLNSKPIYVLYGHPSEVKVTVGQRVNTGDVVALVGMTGVAEGPHLHLEVRYDQNEYSATVNPDLWIRPLEGYGTIAGAVLNAAGEYVPEARVVLYRPSAPDKPARDAITYPRKEVNPDPAWRENWAAGDLPAGQWIVKLVYHQRLYTETVTVEPGATAWVTFRVAE